MQRLISRAELVRRVDVTKAYVYRECKEGGKLHAALIGTNVDLDHPAAYAFCKQHNYTEPDGNAIAVAAAAKQRKKTKPTFAPAPHDTIAPDDIDEDEINGAENFMNLTLREIVKRYGRQAQFKEYVAAYKILVGTQKDEEKIARDRKEYAHWSHLERMAMHIDGLHKLLMADVAKNIAGTVADLTEAGASPAEIRKAITEIHEQVIQMAKQQSDRIIRNAKQ